MKNLRPGVKISPRIEQHKLRNTFSKYLVHVSNSTANTMAWGQVKEYGTISNSMEA